MDQKTIDRVGLGIKIFGGAMFLVAAVLFAISIYGQLKNPKPGPIPPLTPEPPPYMMSGSASVSASAPASASASASASVKKP